MLYILNEFKFISRLFHKKTNIKVQILIFKKLSFIVTYEKLRLYVIYIYIWKIIYYIKIMREKFYEQKK